MEIIKKLQDNGWVLKRSKGSHRHFIHPKKKGLVTVPHPKRQMPIGALISIEKQCGFKLRSKK